VIFALLFGYMQINCEDVEMRRSSGLAQAELSDAEVVGYSDRDLDRITTLRKNLHRHSAQNGLKLNRLPQQIFTFGVFYLYY
jgi:hypothetical protein